MLDEIGEDLVECLLRLRLDGDAGVARIDPPRADLALANLERSADLQDPIQDLRQDQGIDDMAANLDLFDGRRDGRRLRVE